MTEISEEKSEKVLPKVTIPGVRANRVIPKRKLEYAKKLKELLQEYDTCLIVTVDNVGSAQIQNLRKSFRGRARFLFGKNTLIRKVIREYMKETGNSDLLALMDLVRGNGGFIFTKESVADIRSEIINNKVQCAARAGSIAPVDVYVPPGPTGMEPTQTGFFQAMKISTRVQGGQISILDEVKLLTKGEKVGASEASLLVKLGIRPFYYGMKVVSIYQAGEAFSADVLDLTDEDIAQSFYVGLRNVAALCFSINYPTIINVPHSILNAYKKVVSLGLSLKKYKWDNLELIRDMLENPGKFTGGGGGGGTTATTGGGTAAVVKEETPEPESSEAGPTGMFDEDSSEEESEEESESE